MPTRRDFISGTSAAIAALAVTPTNTASAVATPEKAGYWGYSLDGEIYNQLDAKTKEEAIAEVLAQSPEGGADVAWCVDRDLSLPDFRDTIANHMAGDETNFIRALVQDAEGANEDADYEGEIGAEICRADTTEFEREARIALDAAMVRYGRPDLIGCDFQKNPLSSDDPVLDLIDHDEKLAQDMTAACARWFDRAGIWNVGGRILDIYDEYKIPLNSAELPSAAAVA